MSLKKIFHRFLCILINRIPSRSAETIALMFERRLGIGAGAYVQYSGEAVAFQLLGALSSGVIVLFDVGANVGDYTKMAISHMPRGSKYDIHCFEPLPDAANYLREQFAEQKHIFINEIALGVEEGVAPLYMDSRFSRLASLTRRDLNCYGIRHDSFVLDVSILTIDQYALSNNIASIDLLKIDVEGHELDVLKGAEKLIDHGAIKLVQFEFGGCNIDTRTFFKDIYNFLIKKGYNIYRILPNSSLFALPYYRDCDERFKTTNFLAIRNDIDISKTGVRVV